MKNLGLKYETHIQPWDSKRTENLAGNILFNLHSEYYFLNKAAKGGISDSYLIFEKNGGHHWYDNFFMGWKYRLLIIDCWNDELVVR